MDWLDTICQAAIFALGAAGIYLLGRNDKSSKYGMILGLMSQPFWFVSTWRSGSWGMFAVSFVYTMMYANGIRNWFGKKGKKK